ncbi:protein TPX2-like isoform X1 [Vigna umbellata]|uniref:protein TPX2-like isoform X1 n=1 Tax=Vigna umbellata TaxID=87088 RepID=UPI001F5EB87A|nr:protein TPX2-like isoform X1 [Vigna umbellata]
MMMMMVQEEEMEIEDSQVFVAHEIDLDYEFDAVRFFDFSVQETPDQARQAQLWFQSAVSYPPSPFVVKLVVREDESEGRECATTVHGAKPNNVPSGIGFSRSVFHYDGGSKGGDDSGNISALLSGVPQDVNGKLLQVTPGLTFSSKTINGNLSSKVKPAAMKGSTLMKPTASQLAKQNRPHQIVSSRFQKVQDGNKKMNLSTSFGIECQAAKRQKLEGGSLHKVGDVKQQVNFVHKAPKKVASVDQNCGHSKLKITIPREPDLETAHRAQRIRPKNAAEAEVVTVAAPRFKARPLNRKILNAPSLPFSKRSTPRLPEFQEFHLKTQERAMQHTSASSSSSLHCNDSNKDLEKPTTVSAQENRIGDFRRPSGMGAPKHDGLDFAYCFKARPLNKKILSSKGDIGVFRNRKQETTVPMEFNFHTEKRIQHNPPIELFSKMSLTSEVQSNNGSHLKLHRHSKVFREDSKENIGSSFHGNAKETPFIFGGKQIHSRREGCDPEAGTLLTARRSLGIR